MKVPSPSDLEAELAGIRELSLGALRARWREMTQWNAPKIFSRDLLARISAHRIQEQEFGGLSRETRKLLDQLAKGDRERVRHLKDGTLLVRQHQGTLHQVMARREISNGKLKPTMVAR